MGLEAVELWAAQDAVESIREQAVKLGTLHSVTGMLVLAGIGFGVIWHHITCL